MQITFAYWILKEGGFVIKRLNMDQNRFNKGLVYTIRDLCRVCFTCVRECPVKAIKIINGQAEVLDERCIGCGNCTKVCSQGAKVFIQSGDEMRSC